MEASETQVFLNEGTPICLSLDQLPNIYEQDIQTHKQKISLEQSDRGHLDLQILYEYQWIYSQDQLNLKNLMLRKSDMEKTVAKNKASLMKAEVTFQQIERQIKQGKRIEVVSEEWQGGVI